MNFSSRFVDMITGILNSARLLILINGSPYGYFSCSRGVRQGDPLSPLLFCFLEKALARWIDFDIDTCRLSVHDRLSRYLFHVDDIMIFLEVTSMNHHHIYQLLVNYGKLSGQFFSLNKLSVHYSNKTLDSFKRRM